MTKSGLSLDSGVYCITCVPNGRIYIGSSKRMDSRWCQHKSSLRGNVHPNKHLQHAWNKYGEEAFTVEVLELCEVRKCVEREQYYLDKLQPFRSRGFNIAIDAKAPTKQGLSIETCDRMSANYGKRYIVTSPNGQTTEVGNITRFCRENGLSRMGMTDVAKGKASYYKGWKVHYTDEIPGQRNAEKKHRLLVKRRDELLRKLASTEAYIAVLEQEFPPIARAAKIERKAA